MAFAGISHTASVLSAPSAGSVLENALISLPLPKKPPPQSLLGGASKPLTFQRKVKTSGYGSVKPFKPQWAQRSAARAGIENVELPHVPLAGEGYPPFTPPLTQETYNLWEASSRAVCAASRGATLSSTGRTSTSTAGGARVAGEPLSVASGLAAGALFALALSSCGTSLALAGTEGMLSAVVGGRLGRVTRHDGARPPSGPLPPPLHISASVYPGLVPRMVQASAAAAASAGARGGASLSADAAPPSRLLLGLTEGGASLWATGPGGAAAAPLLSITRPTRGDMGAAGSGGGGEGGAAAPFQPTACALCYMDRLIALSTGKRVYIYKYRVSEAEEEVEEDVGAARWRVEARRYACCASWDVEGPPSTGSDGAAPGGVTVTSLAALNDTRSPYLLAACSDKSVRVWDLNAAGGGEGGGGGLPGGVGAPPEVLRVEGGAASRAIHALALPSASAHAQCPASSLDCMLTASSEGGGVVRLWDLRSATCARQLSGGHTSRALPCGVALSPCATKVATGSEDKRAVVYDLRGGGGGGGGGGAGALERHSGASEAVTAVAWHPLLPRLFAGSLDGGVRCYVE